MSTKVPDQVLDAIAIGLMKQGLLIEAGFQGYLLHCFPNGLPDFQRHELRCVFFAGAHHLFATIMRTLDPGEEPTDADLARIGQISAELEAFIKDFQMRHLPTAGTA